VRGSIGVVAEANRRAVAVISAVEAARRRNFTYSSE
jgi:hypothetical protein